MDRLIRRIVRRAGRDRALAERVLRRALAQLSDEERRRVIEHFRR